MVSSHAGSALNLETLPPIFILPTFLDLDELHAIEEQALQLGAKLTYDANEARIFLGRITQKKRAAFELRSQGLWTEDEREMREVEPSKKRQRIDTSDHHSTLARRSGSDDGSVDKREPAAIHRSPSAASRFSLLEDGALQDQALVLKLNWLHDCVKSAAILPADDYLVYVARRVAQPDSPSTIRTSPSSSTFINADAEAAESSERSPVTTTTETLDTILARAVAEAPQQVGKGHPTPYQGRRRLNQKSTPAFTHSLRPPKLIRTTTSEFEASDSEVLPEPPGWVQNKTIYACLRSTPLISPNDGFISELDKIKESRQLTLDEIGVRAYATSIAAIAAYPHAIRSPLEILRLPGCDQKIAALFVEYWDSSADEAARFLPSARALEQDEHLRHLKLFHDIWGVGPDTARKFYFDRGWKDLDDVVEFGWETLTRVQQIGVKFYDEFLDGIPRPEVEQVAATVLRHVRMCRGIRQEDWATARDAICVVVGGYRRGKERSGDVDVVLSHRDERMTKNLVVDVVASLEREGWVTHTLVLHTTTSDRGQATLPFRTDGARGHGFDSLDKALCVWQDPEWEGRGQVDEHGHARKNPNIHRRVDIIISAWRTVGCAILGWSGGNTFQRDIRRYVKRSRGWKFDSSGVRDRASGLVLNLEAPTADDPGDTWLDRERRLMDGLGIGWRAPAERCTR